MKAVLRGRADLSKLSVWIIHCKSGLWCVLFSSICFASRLSHSTCLLSQTVSDSVSLMWLVAVWLSIESRFFKKYYNLPFYGIN